MYTTIQFLHSYWGYLTLLIIVLATLNSFMGIASKRGFADKDGRISVFALIVTHIQVIIGIILFFVSPNALKAIQTNGMGEVMKDSLLRLFTVEHPLIMLIAVILITIGYSRHKKKQTSKTKFKTIAIFYTIALILVLSRIPWAQWFD
jgi:NADH:ubiquinone oxidoreductase subunit 2 (subunit N)